MGGVPCRRRSPGMRCAARARWSIVRRPCCDPAGSAAPGSPSMLRHAAAVVCATAIALCAGAASGADKVVFATNWKAEAEHGGFYQAVADGTYAKYGLDVTIRAGGPQS